MAVFDLTFCNLIQSEGLFFYALLILIFPVWCSGLRICWGFLKQEESEFGLPRGNNQLLTLGLGLLATALAAAYVTRLAKVNSMTY